MWIEGHGQEDLHSLAFLELKIESNLWEDIRE